MKVIATLNKRDADAFRKAAQAPEWVRQLEDGAVLIVDKRPNWSIHKPTVLRSKKTEQGIAIWLEEKDPMQAVVDAAQEDAPEGDSAETARTPDEPVERALKAVKDETGKLPAPQPEEAPEPSEGLVAAAAGIFDEEQPS